MSAGRVILVREDQFQKEYMQAQEGVENPRGRQTAQFALKIP